MRSELNKTGSALKQANRRKKTQFESKVAGKKEKATFWRKKNCFPIKFLIPSRQKVIGIYRFMFPRARLASAWHATKYFCLENGMGGGGNWEGGSGAVSRLRLSCFLVLVLLIDRGCFYSLCLIYSGLGDFHAHCLANRKSKPPVGPYLCSKCQ